MEEVEGGWEEAVYKARKLQSLGDGSRQHVTVLRFIRTHAIWQCLQEQVEIAFIYDVSDRALKMDRDMWKLYRIDKGVKYDCKICKSPFLS